jgi:Cu/Ag efflux protein CusF
MKFTVLLFAALFMWNCGPSAPHDHNNSAPAAAATPVPTASIPKDGNYTGKGVVTKVDMEAGTVEIDHEEIKDMMTAMTMMFNTKDKSVLKGIDAGDKVEFVLQYKHPTEIVTSITKIR